MQTRVLTQPVLQQLLKLIEECCMNPDELYHSQIVNIVIVELPHQWVATITYL